ncbi:MAG: chemotaxis response regulator protein-glutamate methylesterase [Candidatus Auribacter fodinae]|jgi:two-component system chemotaxis response regulator CheB|uniref:Protein-glutamate methylesterase/protein-glutamine glutaminase n=1 Tax=Candidatus Auribacter fodinae TaxID=2093366 RepID=A0A3A4QQR4_9BACT|nr:MAG: chemotaxis response regulator protein-glutamate methylesterase [Candidatus Auribacter fodinae]
MIKVLIADDSSFMRRELTRIMSQDPDIDVVGTAYDGEDVLTKIDRFQPDVVTLDVEMPRMNGITALKHIMIMKPLPVLMISSLTQRGAETTLEALRLGAVDVIAKPSGNISLDIKNQEAEIIEKIKAAASVDCSKIQRIPEGKVIEKKKTSDHIHMYEFPQSAGQCKTVIAIGVSTGGPNTLMNIIPSLPADLPAPVLIVQHMPPMFTKSFAERLDRSSQLHVKEAEDKDQLVNGVVYVAPGDFHMTVHKSGKYLCLSKEPAGTLHRPSVDVMMDSVADVFKGKCVGVILTGMGKDGARALKRLHDYGAKTIGESEASAIVYGMPREAAQLGAVDYVLHNTKIASKIIDLIKTATTV